MNTTLARIAALPLLAAAVFGGAVLAGSGAAHADAGLGGQAPTGPGHSFSPQTHAHPAPSANPGWHGNHGPARIDHLAGLDGA
ncbi:hypothetical protein [Mycolicibacterium grossiae]|uniref:Uncharacterized protein n=1 Tax=Mycolicibacterium grossiae TaxID=1552759 RepID=A0A1E8Q159_9MYCO|nr:hypothetical protein [Mycolicibacterium grossiae]OFJ52292.1 hypothetical protein BEL07_18220 [Mycolicibacterium grossiae]QEM44874.1 hypothetical protein FZ046_08830 [Mycolicibacterium grossiae]